MSGLLALAWVIAAGVVLGGPGGVTLLGLGVGLALVMALALLGPLGSIEVERILPTRPLRAGDAMEISLRVRSARWWPWLALHLEDVGPATWGGCGNVRLSLLSRRPVAVSYRIPRLSRGVYTLGAVHISASDPLGLVRRQRVVAIPGELEVWPVPAALEEVRGLLPAAGRPVLAMAVGETRGARPYSPGDAPQHIHWPATAKTGQLLVRQLEDRCPTVLQVVVDVPAEPVSSAPMPAEAVPSDPTSLFERALSQAAGVIEWGMRQHCSVGLDVAAEYVPPARGQAYFQRLMHLLAACRPGDERDVSANERVPQPAGAWVVRVTGEGQS